MRSAGCIFNDIVDRGPWIKKFKEPKKDLLLRGKISILNALLFTLVLLCLTALLILSTI